MPSPALAEWYVAVFLMVAGVSHATAAREWLGFFRDLLDRPWGGLVLGLMHLMPGLAILLAHPAWGWSTSVIVTVLGWAWTIKGSLYLVWPRLPARIARPHLEHPGRFRVAGLVLIVLGAAVLAGRLTA